MPLNKEHFVTVAGGVDAYDEELRRRCKNDESLCRVQEEQYRRGRRSIELHHTIHGYTWRDGSGLSEWAIRWRGKTLQGALQWADEWAEGDPGKREAYVRRHTLEGIIEAEKNGTKLFEPSGDDARQAEHLLRGGE